MLFYLTYNEGPSGIYSSQVIDVVKFLNRNSEKKTKLLALISLRNFFSNRKIIKDQLADALVFPMFPKMNNWRSNLTLLKVLCYKYKPTAIVARSVMATKLALSVRDSGSCGKVVYDGRGAIAAEWREYKVVLDKTLLQDIENFESDVILKSDFRIAVSNALVNFWRKKYGYSGTEHVVIPCTLSTAFLNVNLSPELILQKRTELGLNETDTVFIYSGSLAEWQSFDLTRAFIEPILKVDKTKKIIFFSPSHPSISELMEMFPGQVTLRRFKASEVQRYLIVGDYGLLIRENSETNQVASPVKYAEYLSCGLKVIISENLGDYTNLSQEKNWGDIFDKFDATIAKPDLNEKIKISLEATEMFTKNNYILSYKKLLTYI